MTPARKTLFERPWLTAFARAGAWRDILDIAAARLSRSPVI